MVQLRDVVPRGKVGIARERREENASGRLDSVETGSVALKIVLRALHVELRVLARPRMVSDKVEKQPDSPRMQLCANRVQRIPGSDARIGNVMRDGIGRGNHIGRLPAWQRAIVLRDISRVGERDPAGFRAAPPHSHQPDNIEAEASE